MKSNLLFSFSVLVGCSTACSLAPDDGAESAEEGLSASLVGDSGKLLSVGTSAEVVYTGQPRYLAIGTVFTSATRGMQTVTVEPLDAQSDAAVWITDGGYGNL